jgi:4-alpha-glucanotransferase
MNDDSRRMILPPFPPEYRASGVLLHVAWLPSPHGIGDVGPPPLAWVNRLNEAGQTWWQALPLGPTGYGNSPYQFLSSFAGNELLVSPDGLIEDGLLRASDCMGTSFSAATIDYNIVIPFKHRLLKTAWTTFRTGARGDLRPDYEQFCNVHRHWIEDYALFRALKAEHNDAYYLEWPAELVRRTPAALALARRNLADQIDQVRFAQFLLFRQGRRLQAHARANGVRLIGDLPFFVSPDSSDVWANPELFLLDEQHKPRFVAGVPPDYFSVQGQLWGNPVYDWDAVRRTGYGWCLDRLGALLGHVDNSPRSFPSVRSRLARANRSSDGPNRPMGARSGCRLLPHGRKGVRRPPVHRRGSGGNHARCKHAAGPVPVAGNAGAPIRVRRQIG